MEGGSDRVSTEKEFEGFSRGLACGSRWVVVAAATVNRLGGQMRVFPERVVFPAKGLMRSFRQRAHEEFRARAMFWKRGQIRGFRRRGRWVAGDG